jgi:hypothetical protein
MDILPVERGDEHPVQPGHNFVGDFIGLVFQPFDGIHNRSSPERIGLEQIDLECGGLDTDRGNRREQVEEFLVTGQEAHRSNLGVGTGGGEDSPTEWVGKRPLACAPRSGKGVGPCPTSEGLWG